MAKVEGDFFPSAVRRFHATGHMYGYCRACQVQYYRERGGTKYFERWNTPRRKTLRAWFNGLKDSMSCRYCGETCPQALDFHHRDPSEKAFSLSAQLESFSRKRILAEIAKCDVVCANCHRKLHAGVPVRDVWQDYLDKLPCTEAMQEQ